MSEVLALLTWIIGYCTVGLVLGVVNIGTSSEEDLAEWCIDPRKSAEWYEQDSEGALILIQVFLCGWPVVLAWRVLVLAKEGILYVHDALPYSDDDDDTPTHCTGPG